MEISVNRNGNKCEQKQKQGNDEYRMRKNKRKIN